MSEEEYKGHLVILTAKKHWWGASGEKYYAFLFTPTRLVASKIPHGKTRTAGLLGGGLVGYYLGERSETKKMMAKTEQLKRVSVESILKTDKDNFSIPYDDIRKVEISKAGRLEYPGMGFKAFLKFYGDLIEKKLGNFTAAKGPGEFEDCVDILRSILPDKLVVK